MQKGWIIRRHIHTPAAKQIAGDLEQGNYPEAAALLLAYYYDPR
ncbi:hypothetical protein [Gracilibacillus alcaliphilus]|nr:hypothetical protein [Gracilibacillus alcaliphilus]MBM7678317.1 hypothetical protein [Gracilibacillus alcaliphilus]